jgi:hypothetical protein
MLRRLTLVFLIAFAFSGCIQHHVPVTVATGGTATAPADETPLMQLASFTAADLKQASDNAKASGDLTGQMCWDTLAKYVGTGTLANVPQIKGGASAFQAVRDVRRGIDSARTNPVLEDINRGCAPLITEARITLIKLGLLAGAGVATGGALPALGGMLPIPLK